MVGRICEPETHSVGGRGRALSRTVNVRDGSIASLWPSADYFRSSPGNGHRQGRSACLKGADSVEVVFLGRRDDADQVSVHVLSMIP